MIKIGNAQAFWGDSREAPAELVRLQPDLDYLTLDYLSEVSLSIMAAQRAKDPNAGYARDFTEVIKSLIPFWQNGSKVKIVTNAGGLEPRKCAVACAEILKAAGCHFLKIGVISGDDVVEQIHTQPFNPCFNNLENKTSIQMIIDKLTTANAYVGAKPIVEALQQGADIVITGRVADPSLTVGPCVAHFGWSLKDYDKIAQATVAGHLIECGTQVTGGASTDWLKLNEMQDVGFPVIEMEENGCFVITKPSHTSGEVTIATVKEQLLYEIGDPERYLSPDATVSFLSISLEKQRENRVLVTRAKGTAPPETYKVSATYRDGFKSEGMLSIFGRQAKEKAKRCGEIILLRMKKAGFIPERSYIECLGTGDLVPGTDRGMESHENLECVLRICIADSRKEVLECFSKQIAPLVTCGPQGTTGYTTGRPTIRPIFGYWPCLISVTEVISKVEMIEEIS